MQYTEFAPPAALRSFVRCYWELSGRGPIEPIVPDGCTELVAHFGERVRRDGILQSRSVYVGQMTGPTQLEASGSIGAFGIRFEPVGAWALLGLPQSQLTDRIESLGIPLEKRLLNADSTEERLRITDGFLLSCQPARDLRLSTLIHRGVPVCDVRTAIGLGERQFERLFAEQVGLTPQTFARLLRFRRVLTSDGPWSEIALACGYFDQSHLVRDFRQFAGVSPTAYRPDPFLMSETSKTDFANSL